jgi:class 3 adenylate cyclase
MRRGKNLTDVPECPEYLLRGDLRSLGVSMTDRVTCPACGEANRARARFCDRCGAELQQASEPLPSGKRTVTLLHIDLLRSTSLGERLSPEVRPRAIQAYYEVVDKAILEQGGTIENHLGDGVLAAFGRPEPGVDDALRAVRAAVTVHAAMPELNRQVAEWGVELRVHSAVNTGEVSLAWLLSGEDRGTEVTLGDLANVCAKLNDKARDGQILIGEATWHLVRDEVRVHPGDPLTLRLESREAPVRAWRVLGLEPEGSRHASEARMVGRERYLSQLGLYYDQVVHDHIRDGLMQGNTEARKALLRTLVAEIVVESRNTIRPFFKVPTLTSAVGFQRAVREVDGVVDPAYQHANRPLTTQGPTIRL